LAPVRSVRRLAEAKLALQGLQGLVVIDEIQRRAELFAVLRVLVDQLEYRALTLKSTK
jgi:predicted AAA+ superfamily ATPase